jgi:hypothetical protein
MIGLNFTQLIVFEPLFMKRIWGSRRLEMQFGKRLPQECASANRGRLSTALKRKALCATVHCAVERCMNSGHKSARNIYCCQLQHSGGSIIIKSSVTI